MSWMWVVSFITSIISEILSTWIQLQFKYNVKNSFYCQGWLASVVVNWLSVWVRNPQLNWVSVVLGTEDPPKTHRSYEILPILPDGKTTHNTEPEFEILLYNGPGIILGAFKSKTRISASCTHESQNLSLMMCGLQ